MKNFEVPRESDWTFLTSEDGPLSPMRGAEGTRLLRITVPGGRTEFAAPTDPGDGYFSDVDRSFDQAASEGTHAWFDPTVHTEASKGVDIAEFTRQAEAAEAADYLDVDYLANRIGGIGAEREY
ncbi:MAG TPA: hypothetical protein VJP80_04340 [Candidatus Saccharimonadales bacterium]|nr:hypothetical protein [Candidatus Saccharimonadales bacterium]